MMVLRHQLRIGENSIFIGARDVVLKVALIKSGEDSVSVWTMRLDADAETVERKFLVVGTGHEFDFTPTADCMDHVGTALDPTGEYVWHVFERFAAGSQRP